MFGFGWQFLDPRTKRLSKTAPSRHHELSVRTSIKAGDPKLPERLSSNAAELRRRIVPPSRRIEGSWGELSLTPPVIVLLLLLVVSFALRVTLAVRGGQYFWPDEARFGRSFALLGAIQTRDWRKEVDLLTQPDHTLFPLVGLLPASVEELTEELVEAHSHNEYSWMAASGLSVFAVATIAIVYLLGLRGGLSNWEAVAASCLTAVSNTLFYFSAHLGPYDVSLFLGLLLLWFMLHPTTHTIGAIAIGLGAALTFLVYNGNWAFILTLLVLFLAIDFSWRAAAFRVALGAIGFSLPYLILVAVQYRRSINVASTIHSFASLAATGEFDLSEGWSLPFAYLWHSEHLVAVVWAVGMIVAMLRLFARRQQNEGAWLWVFGFVCMYCLFVGASTVLHKIVVCARYIRPMIPFMALSAVYAARELRMGRWRERLLGIVGVVVLIQATFNLSQPFFIRYPREVRREVMTRYGKVAEGFTLEGPRVVDAASSHSRLILLNAAYLHPLTGRAIAPPNGRELLRVPHPLSYKPYQYEGYAPEARDLLRNVDISMRLIELW